MVLIKEANVIHLSIKKFGGYIANLDELTACYKSGIKKTWLNFKALTIKILFFVMRIIAYFIFFMRRILVTLFV
jgi:hypothetical protein